MQDGRTSRPESLLGLIDEHLLPLRAVRINMVWDKDVELPFFHHTALRGFLKSALDLDVHDESRIRIDAVENSRTHYRAGEGYAFDVFCLGGDGRELACLIESFNHPVERPGVGVFDGTWHLAEQGLVNYFSTEPVIDIADIVVVYSGDFLAAALELCDESTISVQLLTPLRMRKFSSGDRRIKSKQRPWVRNSEDLSLAHIFSAAYLRWATMLRDHGQSPPPLAALPDALTTSAQLFWVDDKSFDAEGQSKTLAGALGVVEGRASNVPVSWWQILLLGQFVGLGTAGHYGLGRYRLESSETGFLPRSDSARNWLQTALRKDSLHAAFEHVMSARKRTDQSDWRDETGGLLKPDVDPSTEDKLSRLAEKLLANRYTVPPNHLVLIPKPNGKYRPLSIAPDWDAVLQRAVSQTLQGSIDTLFHRHSYGFRRGYSRHQAADAIGRLKRKGFGHIFDADIEDFFGSVNHHRLYQRLLCLLGDDPAVSRIMDWVRAPVHYQGESYPRRQGLGQGSSLSPLLANLMLDDFDQDMAAAGVEMVRFADDFVLLAKDTAALAQAAKMAKTSLAEHGFLLNLEKSQSLDPDDRLDFLGFLFVGDLVIESTGDAHRPVVRTAPPEAGVANHWLAKLSARKSTAAEEPDHWVQAGRDLLDDIELNNLSTAAATSIVFITGERCQVKTSLGQMVVTRDEKDLGRQAWQHIDALLVLGNHHLTTPAIKAANAAECRIYLCTNIGKCVSVLQPPYPKRGGQETWLAQAALAHDKTFSLSLAKMLVNARIRHQSEVMRLKAQQQVPNSTLKQVKSARTLAQLNGLEGSAAAHYFAELGDLVDSRWAFAGRDRRPPTDPFNALLSLGYTVLYQHADVLLQAHGLLPYCGFYHQPYGRHSALASDMMEPFRHIIERVALNTLANESLGPDDFYSNDADGACLLCRPLLRSYLAAVNTRLDSKVTTRDQTVSWRVRDQLSKQIHSLKMAILQQDPTQFRPFLVR